MLFTLNWDSRRWKQWRFFLCASHAAERFDMNIGLSLAWLRFGRIHQRLEIAQRQERRDADEDRDLEAV